MIASGEKFGFVLIERWLSKNIAFFKDWIIESLILLSGIFKKRSLGGILVGELFQNTLLFL
ncbi:hypothetical protein BGL63_03530 [Helicobacter pylori]|nr:hypothetical protein BGL63_03530 [Helicobacter pylori]OPG34136.1 hypothetical protein BGL64_08215 [Helicobacter pylori]